MIKKFVRFILYIIRILAINGKNIRIRGFVRIGSNGRFSGKNIELRGPLILSNGYDIFCINSENLQGRIEINSGYIGRNFHCVSAGDMQLGDSLLVANNVFVSNCGHGTELNGIPFINQKLKYYGPIKIGRNVWIGEGSHVIGSLEIGDNVIIGNNEVVKVSIPCNSIFKNGGIHVRK